jgi:uncharacterized protein
MDCPVDGATLLMSERQGVEIDYCPQCRGVWLDRGELDKLIARGDDDRDDSRRGPDPRYERDRPDYDRPQAGYKKPHKKRKGLLSEIFDFE